MTRDVQVDRMSELIGQWDSQCPASEDNTTLVVLLAEMRKRIIRLEAHLEQQAEEDESTIDYIANHGYNHSRQQAQAEQPDDEREAACEHLVTLYNPYPQKRHLRLHGDFPEADLKCEKCGEPVSIALISKSQPTVHAPHFRSELHPTDERGICPECYSQGYEDSQAHGLDATPNEAAPERASMTLGQARESAIAAMERAEARRREAAEPQPEPCAHEWEVYSSVDFLYRCSRCKSFKEWDVVYEASR